MKDFIQEAPKLFNSYTSDSKIQKVIKANFKSGSDFKLIDDHLRHVGELAVTDWLNWGQQAQTQLPKHIPYSPWGERIDQIEMSEGWKNLEKAAAVEGVVAAAYERKFGSLSRVYQMSLLYLYSSSSAFCSCPLAMTDGAARAIELSTDQDLKKTAFQKLTSRDPQLFWTSGQWMTEKTGGSDVSQTSTMATLIEGSYYSLKGTKWFTSATTSQMALTLARIDPTIPGNKGLSMFYLELRDQNNRLNSIEVHQLKDKLGTKALPTAELSLNGTKAKLIGAVGAGIKTIATVLNTTRMYNAICSLSHMRRALDLATDYSKKRMAFGQRLIDLPLHKATLIKLENEFNQCFDLTFWAVGLLGKEDLNDLTENEKIVLRSVTPLVKLYTAKKAIEISSEVVEMFGGAGYVEDVGVSYLLRDAQVFSIWEGTTNVLVLDFIRVCEKEFALEALDEYFGLTPNQDKSFKQMKSTINISQGREFVFEVISRIHQLLNRK